MLTNSLRRATSRHQARFRESALGMRLTNPTFPGVSHRQGSISDMEVPHHSLTLRLTPSETSMSF